MSLIKNKLHLIIIVLVLLAVSGRYLWHLDSNKGFSPDQPIPFSHKIHATDYKMDCLYCHSSAEKGPHAGIPPMNVCMGCHSVVGLDKENIKKLNQMYQDGQTVQWERIHRLPDHVYFSHKMHLRAGVSCMDCHGDVATMPVVEQFNRLEMGDCLECHRNNQFAMAYMDSVMAMPEFEMPKYELGNYETPPPMPDMPAADSLETVTQSAIDAYLAYHIAQYAEQEYGGDSVAAMKTTAMEAFKQYQGGDYSANSSSLAAANSAMEAFMRYQAAGGNDQAYNDSLSEMLGAMTGENDRYYPYMKYIDPNTMTSGVEARIHGMALYKKLPARLATGVFPGHNAMTQCSTCHQ